MIRTATFPTGTSDARCASMTHRGVPGGCATPSPWAATINSPLSVRVTVGASVQLYTTSATRNTAPAQTSSALRGERPRADSLRAAGFVLLLRLDVACGSTRHLPIVSQTGVPANHQSDASVASRQLQQTTLFPRLARFNHHEHEIITPRGCFVRGFRNKHHRAISNSGAISRTTTCGLRSALGRQDSNARQGRTERDVVFACAVAWRRRAEDSRRLTAEDASDLYTDAVHFRHVPCARRLFRVTRLCVRARRCSRPRQFRRRVRAVRK